MMYRDSDELNEERTEPPCISFLTPVRLHRSNYFVQFCNLEVPGRIMVGDHHWQAMRDDLFHHGYLIIRKHARSSFTNVSGCSKAAKCPPFSSSLK